MFQDWKEKVQENPCVSKHLLWEYDLEDFDWDDMQTLVVQRVIERGRPNDFYAILKLYGGIDGVKEIIKKIPQPLHPKDLAFVCTVFHLKKDDLLCYTKKLLREQHLKS